MFYEPITILSAELPNLDYYANVDRTNELRLALLNMGLPIVGVTKVQDGKKFQSFMVTTPHHEELLPLAQKFGQKSVLVSDISRITREVSTTDEKTMPMGKLYLASKDNALKQKLYLTFWQDGKEYFFVTENQ